MPRDAEAWLAERGVRRDPLKVAPSPPAPPEPPSPSRPAPEPESGDAGPVEAGSATGAVDGGPGGPSAGSFEGPSTSEDVPAVGAREAARLASQAAADLAQREADAAALPDPSAPRLEDDVAAAVAFIRRSTAVAPQTEARIRTKLAERGYGEAVLDVAMERARRERLVDDLAMAAALVDERRRKGHAIARIRRDLRARGFDDDTLEAVLADTAAEDPEAAAFEVARRRAGQLTSLDAERAYRRVVGHVARRGYPEGLARKVARAAVFDARDPQRTAGH